MPDYNWSKFTKRVTLNASEQSVYRAWCTPAGLESWFLRKALFKNADGIERTGDEYISVSDSYEWYWHGWPDEVVETGTILQLNDVNELQFTFGKAGNVSVKIYPEENNNICELSQTNIPTDEQGKTYYHLGCSAGWIFYLANLKSILEGGIDLRNKNVDIKNVINS